MMLPEQSQNYLSSPETIRDIKYRLKIHENELQLIGDSSAGSRNPIRDAAVYLMTVRETVETRP
jgi:hypothetical protein